jgi:hypothetical protein
MGLPLAHRTVSRAAFHPLVVVRKRFLGDEVSSVLAQRIIKRERQFDVLTLFYALSFDSVGQY